MTRPTIAAVRARLPTALLRLAVLGSLVLAATAASGAEGPYPFEGSWVQPDHVCAPGATRVRTFTAKEVTSPRGRCTIRRIASNGNTYELFEECRYERNQGVAETLRMTSPDSLVSRRQIMRLKVPRAIRYVRCTVAAPGSAAPPRQPGRSFVPEPHKAP